MFMLHVFENKIVACDTLHRYMIHNPQILVRQELLQNESLKYCVQVFAS